MSTPVNIQHTKLTRGRPALLGTLSAANTDSVQFAIPEPTRDFQGALVIQTTGTAGTSPTLEGSIDGAATWFVIPSTLDPILAITGQLTGDAAATFAAVYRVNGMGAGTIFRFGFAGGSPTANKVWALVG